MKKEKKDRLDESLVNINEKNKTQEDLDDFIFKDELYKCSER